MIYRGTTPTINLLFKNDAEETVDLSTYTVYLYISSNGEVYKFTNSRMTFNADHSIDITLTQSETLAFSAGTLEVQLRAKSGTTAICSDIVSTTINDILEGGVI